MMMLDSFPGYYTVQQAVAIIDRSEATITRYCQDGRLKALFVRKQWFIEQASAHEFEKPLRGNPMWRKTSVRSKRKSKK